MSEIICKPHQLIIIQVSRRWFDYRLKGFFQRLLELGEIKPTAIIIKQAESYNEEYRYLSETIMNQWKYDNTGLQILPMDMDTEQQPVDYCCYCIDKDRQKLVIDWATIMGSMSTRKRIHYHHHGAVYDIFKNNGIDDFELVRSWME